MDLTCRDVLVADGQTNLQDLVLLGSIFGISVPALQCLGFCSWSMWYVAKGDTRELKVQRDKAASRQVIQNSGKVIRKILPSDIHAALYFNSIIQQSYPGGKVVETILGLDG